MILNAIAEKLKRQSKDDFKGRHFELIVQAVAWYLRYPLSYRDLEEMFRDRGLQQGIESDHFPVQKDMPKIGGFQSFNPARRTIAGFEAMLLVEEGLRLFPRVD